MLLDTDGAEGQDRPSASAIVAPRSLLDGASGTGAEGARQIGLPQECDAIHAMEIKIKAMEALLTALEARVETERARDRDSNRDVRGSHREDGDRKRRGRSRKRESERCRRDERILSSPTRRSPRERSRERHPRSRRPVIYTREDPYRHRGHRDWDRTGHHSLRRSERRQRFREPSLPRSRGYSPPYSEVHGPTGLADPIYREPAYGDRLSHQSSGERTDSRCQESVPLPCGATSPWESHPSPAPAALRGRDLGEAMHLFAKKDASREQSRPELLRHSGGYKSTPTGLLRPDFAPILPTYMYIRGPHVQFEDWFGQLDLDSVGRTTVGWWLRSEKLDIEFPEIILLVRQKDLPQDWRMEVRLLFWEALENLAAESFPQKLMAAKEERHRVPAVATEALRELAPDQLQGAHQGSIEEC